ncbi:MAG: hypothetical protein ACR2NM_17235, partial [Bythopirellula sp.]
TTAMLLIVLSGFIGCQQDQIAGSSSNEAADVDGSKFLLSTEPEGARDVIAVREAAADGDDVLVVGRIGGGENPWVEGRAAFSLVDNSLKACSDIPGDMCKKPWDYCCETDKLPASTALIKVVGEDGDLVRTDARKLLNVKELSTVVVKGKAQRDDTGNLVVLATGVYVVKQ